MGAGSFKSDFDGTNTNNRDFLLLALLFQILEREGNAVSLSSKLDFKSLLSYSGYII